MGLKGRDLVSIRDLSREEVVEVLKASRRMLPYSEGSKIGHQLEGKVLTLAFFEPSTRTRLSFETAMARLGGRSVTISDPSASSLRKGETLYDTIRVIGQYGDAVVLRHPNEGAARLAAQASDRPVINAGDGAGQHPTQTLIDLATIEEKFGTLQGLNVVLLGDLKYGRTVHSLARALALFGTSLVLTAPPTLAMPEEVRKDLDSAGAKVQEEPELERAVKNADVLYVTRIQRERFGDEAEFAKVAGSYRVDPALLEPAKERMIVLHPLPRTGEISPSVDASPHAAYFRQAFLGVPVRMGLLSLILTGKAA
ncbi:MAG: aspartate carbamoyltransferase [Thermoplasmata archaeon]|nr:aspartate carbamoyltransferase [Thermoplasmata archaeon]MCI4358850.1 aspartate carbamoyltransferase [Thermoplasmata archaeon]